METACAYKGRDGHVDGRLSEAHAWLRLRDGEAEPVSEPSEAAPRRAVKYSCENPFPHFPDGTELVGISMANSNVTVLKPSRQRVTRAIRYESEEAQITSVFTGPEGRVYGSTAHLMALFG